MKERRSDWFIDSLRNLELKSTKVVMLGFQKNADPYILEMQKYVKNNAKSANIDVLDYANPYEYYHRSKFFILPTTIVFGNNSLLEAMSCGVVPIVSETQATHLIIKDGENGITFPHNKEGLEKALIRASTLDRAQIERLSKNAIKTVEEFYSQKFWGNKCHKLYNLLNDD